MPASHTNELPNGSRWHPTCRSSSQTSHTDLSSSSLGAKPSPPSQDHQPRTKAISAFEVKAPFCARCQSLLLTKLNQLDIRAADWVKHARSSEWNNCNSRLHHFICNTNTPPPGRHLPRRFWVRLNHLHTGVGRFRSFLHNWGVDPSAACDCGPENQTAEHILAHCTLFSPPHGITGLVLLDDDTITWLHESCPDI